MIRALDVKKLYEDACGYKIYCDIGEIEAAVRNKNEVIYPVCGLFKMQPVQVTAIRAPFIGVASADVEIIAPTHMLEDVRATLNTTVIAALNGSAVTLADEHDADIEYSVSFTVQTCTVGEKSEIGAWYGECVVIRQTVSFVIIEDGVSAYDTVLRIDGMVVPILTLSETKVHSTSVYSDACAIGRTASEQEAYGIDFTTPYVKSELCTLFHNAVNCREGNRAHCVEITKNGVTNAYIMAISSAADTVQPPSNIGFNISLTEISVSVGRFDGRWLIYTHREDRIGRSKVSSILCESGAFPIVVFWGDGESDVIESEENIPYHVYADGVQNHRIASFSSYSPNACREIKAGDKLCGRTLTVKLKHPSYSRVLPAREMFEKSSSSDAAVIFGRAGANEIKYSTVGTDALVYEWSKQRLLFHALSDEGIPSENIYIGVDVDGDDCFVDGMSFVCPVRGRIDRIRGTSLVSFTVKLSELEGEVFE